MAVEKVSPANGQARVTDANRIPMSSGQQKLSVPDIPGFHLHWMLGTPERIQQALQGGYEFVDQSETRMTNLMLGGDATKDGNTDLGTRVSYIAGSEIGNDGQPVRLYLMKIKEEWYQEDMRIREDRSEALRQSLNRGQQSAAPGESSVDQSKRYVGSQTSNMFEPKPIRRT